MRPVFALIALSAALSAQTAAAQPVPCGEPYVIQRGDTLQRIARRAYGPDATYHQLWRANRDALGLFDPSLIEVGQVIFVPCFDGLAAPDGEAAGAAPVTGPDAAGTTAAQGADAAPPDAQAAPDAAPQETAAEPAPVMAPVAAGDAAPEPAPPAIADAPAAAPQDAVQAAAPSEGAQAAAPQDGAQAAAPQDGALSALTPPDAPSDAVAGASAQTRAGPPAAPSAEPPPDPRLIARRVGAPGLADAVVAAALTQTVGALGWRIVDGEAAPGAGAALLFPMTRPDCERPETLAADERVLCGALAWSAPLVEDVMTARSRRDAGPVTSLAGLRVCRAGNAPAPDLSAARSVLSLPDAAACLRATAAGEADLALTLAGAGDAAMAATGLGANLVEQTAMARLVTLRAAAPAGDPAARAALAALDLGLERLRRDGLWFEVVEAALKP